MTEIHENRILTLKVCPNSKLFQILKGMSRFGALYLYIHFPFPPAAALKMCPIMISPLIDFLKEYSDKIEDEHL